MFRHLLILAGALSLASCGDRIDRITSPGSTVIDTATTVADATLPPPSEIPVLVDWSQDAAAAIDTAFDGLDAAATAVDVAIQLKPSLIGTPAAKRIADALEGASTWLTIARQAQHAGQQNSYRGAITQASAALAGAKAAIANLRGK